MKTMLREIGILRTCRDVTRLTLNQQEGPNSRSDKMAIGFHRLTCRGCRRFKRQVAFMTAATAQWRGYRDS
jgi:hypothetical protein